MKQIIKLKKVLLKLTQAAKKRKPLPLKLNGMKNKGVQING